MPTILFVNQFYAPDVASTGQHLTDLAEHAARRGFDVQVLCARGGYEGGRSRLPAREVRAGVEVFRVAGLSPGKRSLMWRVLDALTLQLRFAWRLLWARADVVVTLTTPPMLVVAGALRRALRGGRHVAFMMDLHPDVELALGVVSPRSWLGRGLSLVDRLALRRADCCVALGETMRQRLLEKGVAPERVRVIPVWNRRDEFEASDAAAEDLRDRRGWRDRFVVLYSGNAGLAHTFDDLLSAAERLQVEAPDVRFAFVGGGARLPELRDEVARRELGNVEFHGYAARDEVGVSLASADVHLITLRPEMAGLAAPSKTYAAMAASRPVIFVGPDPSEPATAIHESGAGWVVPPGASRELADRVLELRASHELRERLGSRGRAYFMERHEREVCCDAWCDTLRRVATGDAPVERPIAVDAALGT